MPRYKKIELSELRKVNMAAVFVVLLSILFVSSCDFYYKNMPFVAIPPQTISGPVVIGPEWVEIVPLEPLRPISNSSSYITLAFFDYDLKEAKLCSNTLYLIDGRTTEIEAILTDNKGEDYLLEICGLGGGIDLYPKKSTNTKERKIFPNDRTFVKLKIKSEIPFKCNKIDWINSKPK